MARKTTLGFLVGATAAAFCAVVGASSAPAAAEEDNGCRVSDAEYIFDASVVLRDTPLGVADGVHPLGKGKLRLRFEPGLQGQSVKLMSYSVDNKMTVATTVAWITTTVTAQSRTHTDEDACQGSVSGALAGGKLNWRGPVRGYGSEGTITCEGSMCGKFGAPPKGASPLRDHPESLHLGQFVFSPDGTTFSMPYTEVHTTTGGSQRTFLALSGRRVARSCVSEAAACGTTASAK